MPLQLVRDAMQDFFRHRQAMEKGVIGANIFLWFPVLYFREQRATGPRDKIYAFMGLFTPSVIPEYRFSKSDLYILVTRVLYREDPKIILAVECRTREIIKGGELPSWVPDFTQTQELDAWLKWEDHLPEL
jgi:hypothetical protein